MFDTDTLYNLNFEKTLTNLESQKESSIFDINDVEKALEALYVYEGLDMDGRGELKEAEIASSIAAYQVFITSIKKKLSS